MLIKEVHNHSSVIKINNREIISKAFNKIIKLTKILKYKSKFNKLIPNNIQIHNNCAHRKIVAHSIIQINRIKVLKKLKKIKLQILQFSNKKI